ncbi:unnamed protein product [Pleuronectes platessa]|uniref:Uncharacterized protein n=1 Tax=Pleuronectes platessa TaxID=8262 RepID=A0A9N7TTA9_PLEPL|nr:unnamed protein product [Pleuronectes platessa]
MDDAATPHLGSQKIFDIVLGGKVMLGCGIRVPPEDTINQSNIISPIMTDISDGNFESLFNKRPIHEHGGGKADDRFSLFSLAPPEMRNEETSSPHIITAPVIVTRKMKRRQVASAEFALSTLFSGCLCYRTHQIPEKHSADVSAPDQNSN